MLPKPTYTGGSPAARNASSVVRERALVGQDPGPGLHDVEIRQVLPWGEDRIRRQPDLVREDVIADVVDRGQPDRRAAAVERLGVQRVDALRVLRATAPGCRSHPSGDCLPGRAAGGKCRDGSPKMWKQAST